MNQAVPPGPIERKRAQPFYLQLWFLVLGAMVLGIALGHFYPDAGVRMEPLGDAFIKAIRVLIAPIIFCTVVHGIASMADMAKVGRVALKALIYFEVLTTLALVLGLVAVNVFAPGAGMNVDLSHVDTAAVAPYLAKPTAAPRRNFCSASFPAPSSARSPKATCCKCCSFRCCAGSP
jgi:aerobic C4-dicarboxylate transport protein